MNKKEWIDKLHYELDKQQGNLKVAILSRNGDEVTSSKWYDYLDVQADTNLISKINNRTTLKNEVVIDNESLNNLDEIIEKISEEFQFYKILLTKSKGFHIHLFFNKELVEEQKKAIILKYGGDILKASSKTMISLDCEDCLHWKTNKPIEILIDKFGINEFNEEAYKSPEEEIKESMADVDNDIVELFKDEDGTAYATIKVNNHKENLAISSRKFKQFITKKIYERKCIPPSQEKLNALVSVYAAQALFEGKTYQTYLRAAHVNDDIFIDICDDEWRIIKINKEKIEILNDSPIKFKRYANTKTLVYDLDSEIKDFDLLWNYIPVSDSEKKILRPHIAMQFIPDIPYAILIMYGSKGAGKTFALVMIRKLIDPSSLKILSLAKDKNELVQQVSHHYLPFFDNVRNLSKEYSDFFCRVVTGDGYTKRQLYTDDEDIIYNLKRKVGFNGINIAGQEADLLDRSLQVQLKRIKKEDRKREDDLLNEFEKDRPKITGAIFKIIQKTLNNIDNVKKELNSLPRMADYATWCEAASQACGEKPLIFMNSYFAKIEGLNQEALESNPVSLASIELMKNRSEWKGTPTELLAVLASKASELGIKIDKDWPNAPNALSRKLNETKSNLEDIGISFETSHDGQRRLITIKKNIVNIVKTVNPKESLQYSINDYPNDLSIEYSDIVSNPSSWIIKSEENFLGNPQLYNFFPEVILTPDNINDINAVIKISEKKSCEIIIDENGNQR